MKRYLIWILLLLFLVEGAVMPWLLPDWWPADAQYAPHLVLVAIIYIAVLMNRHYALVFGLVFGLLQDFIYYGHMIGIQSFCMGLTAYLVGLAIRNSHVTMFSTITLIIGGNLVYDSIIYAIYRVFRIVEFPYSWAFTHIILTSLTINLFFALLIYIPARAYLTKSDNKRQDQE